MSTEHLEELRARAVELDMIQRDGAQDGAVEFVMARWSARPEDPVEFLREQVAEATDQARAAECPEEHIAAAATVGAPCPWRDRTKGHGS